MVLILGGFVVIAGLGVMWGGISGRLPAMMAAFIAPSLLTGGASTSSAAAKATAAAVAKAQTNPNAGLRVASGAVGGHGG